MRKQKRVKVRSRYADGWRTLEGYDSCSPHFAIAKQGNEWTVIHIKSGLANHYFKTLREARWMIGAWSGLPFDWTYPRKWAAWQAVNTWLMPWFRESGQVMHRIG